MFLSSQDLAVGAVCATPGMKLRSGGAGRGLARGRGAGPLGRPSISGMGSAGASARIRALTDPKRAKAILGATIKQVQAENIAKAQQIKAYLDKRSGMGYLSYSWYNPLDVARGKPLSDLEKYSEADRQRIYKYFKTSDPKVIEYTFTQANLDGALVNAKAGESLPASTPALKDPEKVAIDTFKAGVEKDLVDAGVAVATAGRNAAEIIGKGLVALPKSLMGMVGYLKWAAIIGGGIAAVVIALPYVRAARAPGKSLQKVLETA